MRVRATGNALLIAIWLCLSAAFPALAQQQIEWRGAYADGTLMTRADLDERLKQHKLWVDSNGESGVRADLRGADLNGVHLSGANLEGANLNRAHLRGAYLNSAHLNAADLRNADLYGAADLSNAELTYVHYGAPKEMVGGADLRGTILSDADLSGADLWGARLAEALFEPKKLPDLQSVAFAGGLALMRYRSNPGPLTELRKQFRDGGYREQERAITYVLNRQEAFKDSIPERLFKWLAFDLTCQYGMSPGRPLRILGVLWLLFSVIYAIFMHSPGTSGLYLVGTHSYRGLSYTQAIQIRPQPSVALSWQELPLLWLGRDWRVLRVGMFFSLMSAFNIGFRDINFGFWLRKLTKREYDLKAVGWARTVSGFQSLLSVYLIALWVLTYFGRPFE